MTWISYNNLWFYYNSYKIASSATIDSGEFIDEDEANYMNEDGQSGMHAAGISVEFGMIFVHEQLWNLFMSGWRSISIYRRRWLYRLQQNFICRTILFNIPFTIGVILVDEDDFAEDDMIDDNAGMAMM